jgi:hypothetical protein
VGAELAVGGFSGGRRINAKASRDAKAQRDHAG